MKTSKLLSLLSIAGSFAIIFTGCESDSDDEEHHNHAATTTTTTVEETRVAPATTTHTRVERY